MLTLNPLPGRYIVMLAPDTDQKAFTNQFRSKFADDAVKVVHEFSIIKGFSADLDANSFAALKADPQVLTVEPNRQVYLQQDQQPMMAAGGVKSEEM